MIALNSGGDKIGSIVILRGIAALSVCVVHIGLIINLKVNRPVDFVITNLQNGVAIFFVISGFILPYSLFKKNYVTKNFFSFLIRRSVRIDPPYWATIVLIFLLGAVPPSAFNLKLLFLHLLYLVPFANGGYWFCDIFWTLAVEFQFYIFIGLAFCTLQKINPYISIAFLILVSVPFTFNNFPVRGIIVFNFYDFAIGYIAYLGYIKRISLSKTITILLIFSIFLMYKVSYLSGSIPLLTAAFILFYKRNSLSKIASFFGNVSYSLYLINIPVTIFVAGLLHNYIIEQYLLFFICFFICILFTYAFYLFIEKPSMNLSKKLRLNFNGRF